MPWGRLPFATARASGYGFQVEMAYAAARLAESAAKRHELQKDPARIAPEIAQVYNILGDVDDVHFSLLTSTDGGIGERQHPRHRPIELTVPDRGFEALNWYAFVAPGKTPVALALGRHLGSQGRRVHFLTRGYGGREAGPSD